MDKWVQNLLASFSFFSQWKCLKFRTYFNENTFSPSSYNNDLQFCSLQLLRYQGTTASCSLGFRFLCSSKCGVLLRHIPCEESFWQLQGLIPMSIHSQVRTSQGACELQDNGLLPIQASFLYLYPSISIVLHLLFWNYLSGDWLNL